MNTVAAYLARHREPLELEAYNIAPDPPVVLITPRFALSAHVVALVLARDGRPALAAKLPRRTDDGGALAREAENLRTVGAALDDDGTTPAVVVFDEDLPHPLLLQQALRGTPLSGPALRRGGDATVRAVVAWCDRLAQASTRPPDFDVYAALALDPARRLADAAGADATLRRLAQRTVALVGDLIGAGVPHVFEHGDLGHPNLLLGDDGRLGVLDFERAHRFGLVGHDAAFFLTYAAMARSAQPTRAAVIDAFYGARPWAMDLLGGHLEHAGLEPGLADTVLAVSCCRVVAAAQAEGLAPRPDGRDAPARHLAVWERALEGAAMGHRHAPAAVGA